MIRLCILALLAFAPGLLAQTWTQTTATPAWGVRADHASASFSNRMWIMGGRGGPMTADQKNDVWSSTDGVTWTQETADAGWSERYGHTCAVFNGKLWMIGGVGGGLATGFYSRNDVWSSPDGVTWTQEVAAANWTARDRHATVVFNNKLWILGGLVQTVETSEVWSSGDGINWTLETTAPWAARAALSAVVFNGRIWIFGGRVASTPFGDVWSSPDGVNWTQEATPPWGARFEHASAAVGNRMWVIGGVDGVGTGATYFADAWSSADCINWTQETPGWSGRAELGAVVHNNTPHVIGGYHGAYVGDVWTRQEAPQITSAPPTSATVGAPYSYTVTASGYPAPVIAASALPGWLKLVGDTLSGVPGPADVGMTGVISITATNMAGTDTQDFQITVQDTSIPGGGTGGMSGGSGSGGGCIANTGAGWLLLLPLLLALRKRRTI